MNGTRNASKGRRPGRLLSASTPPESPSIYFSLIGFAVGIGNVWRFPAVAYANGGSAFLLPYVLSMVFVSIPLMVAELTMGQVLQARAADAMTYFWRRARGVGVASVIFLVLVNGYYNVLVSWCLVFLGHSFRSPLPWGEQTFANAADFFHEVVLEEKLALGLHADTHVVWPVAAALALSWLAIALVGSLGLRWSGKITAFSVCFAYVMLAVLAIFSFTLPGAGRGILYLVEPDLQRLADPQAWSQALIQSLFSTGPCWGVVITFGSFLDVRESTVRPAVVLTLVNALTSLVAGVTVFAILGFLAHERGVDDVGSVVEGGPALAFVAFPEALRAMPVPQLWSILFFAMLATLGLNSLIAGVESISTTVRDSFEFAAHRRAATVCAVSFGLFCCGAPFSTSSGRELLEVADYYIPFGSLLVIAIVEPLVVGWGKGERFLRDVGDVRARFGSPSEDVEKLRQQRERDEREEMEHELRGGGPDDQQPQPPPLQSPLQPQQQSPPQSAIDDDSGALALRREWLWSWHVAVPAIAAVALVLQVWAAATDKVPPASTGVTVLFVVLAAAPLCCILLYMVRPPKRHMPRAASGALQVQDRLEEVKSNPRTRGLEEKWTEAGFNMQGRQKYVGKA